MSSSALATPTQRALPSAVLPPPPGLGLGTNRSEQTRIVFAHLRTGPQRQPSPPLLEHPTVCEMIDEVSQYLQWEVLRRYSRKGKGWLEAFQPKYAGL